LLLAEPTTDADAERGISVAPPRRAGIGFIAAIQLTDASGRVVKGRVSVEPAEDAGASLLVTVNVPDGSAGRSIERSATSFLTRLATRARTRAFAA
jgi:hypothetical protein